MTVSVDGLDELAAAYIAHLEADRVPVNTIKARARTLRSVGCPGTVDRDDLEVWWYARADQVKPSTRANDLANLRSFYKWCQIWEHRADDPTYRMAQPKVDAGLPRPVSRHDLEQIRAHLAATGQDDLRRAILLGAWAGLRVSEAAALTWSDVDLEAQRARVVGTKGHKSRAVAINAVLIDQLLPDTGLNVVTGTAEAYSAARLQRKVNRAIKAAGVDATFHQLRHRYGTIAYQATKDLLAVGRQMGHSSPVTTAIYAQASDAVADRIAAAVVQ